MVERIMGYKIWKKNYEGMEVITKEKIEILNQYSYLMTKSCHVVAFFSKLLSYESDVNHIKKCIDYFLNTESKVRSVNKSLEGFQFIFGITEGQRRYEAFKEKNNNTLKGFILRHGEVEGNRKYKTFKERAKISSLKRFETTSSEDIKKMRLFCKEYWINKGYSLQDAKEKAREYAINNQLKCVEKRKENNTYGPETNPLRKEYWLVRGFSEDMSKVNARNFYDEHFNMSKNILIEKYGESEGIRLRESISEKVRNTMEKVYKTRNFICRTSKESLVFFQDLQKRCEDLGLSDDFIFGSIKTREFYLAKGSEYCYFYDFSSPSRKIIIEYNGTKFHPNKEELTEDEWKSWYSPFTKKSADVVYEEFEKKIAKAREFGYTVLIIWNNHNKEENIQRCINLLTQNYLMMR